MSVISTPGKSFRLKYPHLQQQEFPVAVKIFHNPRCSKSRTTLQLLKDKGLDPEIVLYLDNPPGEEEISSILALLGIGPRELMRKGEPEYREQDLGRAGLDDGALIAAMAATPKLIERPIVLANGKAAIGRPPESVLDIL